MSLHHQLTNIPHLTLAQEAVPHWRQGDLLWEEVCVSAVLTHTRQQQRARQDPRAES